MNQQGTMRLSLCMIQKHHIHLRLLCIPEMMTQTNQSGNHYLSRRTIQQHRISLQLPCIQQLISNQQSMQRLSLCRNQQHHIRRQNLCIEQMMKQMCSSHSSKLRRRTAQARLQLHLRSSGLQHMNSIQSMKNCSFASQYIRRLHMTASPHRILLSPQLYYYRILEEDYLSILKNQEPCNRSHMPMFHMYNQVTGSWVLQKIHHIHNLRLF
jgi:hypothetical protein